jgi:hypothetical protein
MTKVCSSGDKVAKILEETLSDSAIREAIAIEESDIEDRDIAQDSTSGSQRAASLTR